MDQGSELNMGEMKVPDRRYLRWMWRISIGLVVGFFAFVAFAHTPWGRPLLGVLTGVPGCPLGLDDVDGAALEQQRQATLLAQGASAAKADAMPALGFELGHTSFDEATRWAEARSVSCEVARDGVLFRCSDLKLDDGSIAYEVDFHRGAAGKLVALDVSRRSDDPAVASRWSEATRLALTAALGQPDRMTGHATSVWLAAAPFRQRLIEYRRRNYRARSTVTHLTNGGYAVGEQYQWADVEVAQR